LGHEGFQKETDMSFKDDYPEFDSIEDIIRNARAERSAAIGSMIGHAIYSAIDGAAQLLRRFTEDAQGVDAEHERNAIDTDPFLRRAIQSTPWN
jgi:nitric oxide reductase large subunit